MAHTSKHKSTAKDSGTISRTVKQLLQRTINRIHLSVEISDCQIAARLLELPSMIMTDTFAHASPLSLRAFKAQILLSKSASDDPDQNPLVELCERIEQTENNEQNTNKTSQKNTRCEPFEHIDDLSPDDEVDEAHVEAEIVPPPPNNNPNPVDALQHSVPTPQHNGIPISPWRSTPFCTQGMPPDSNVSAPFLSSHHNIIPPSSSLTSCP